MQYIIEAAAQRFKQGDYHAARKLYQKVAEFYGESIVAVNLSLCEQGIQALEGKIPTTDGKRVTDRSSKLLINDASHQINRQLQDTQLLLEKYFVLAQNHK